MSRSRRMAVAFDERTGFKVPARKLRRDGEKGIWTVDPDPVHPQRFRRAPGPDGVGKNNDQPDLERHDVVLDMSVYFSGAGYTSNHAPSLVAALTQPTIEIENDAARWGSARWGDDVWGSA